jgi:hypothetical protein
MRLEGMERGQQATDVFGSRSMGSTRNFWRRIQIDEPPPKTSLARIPPGEIGTS